MQTKILPQATETSEKNSEIRKFKMADGRRIENHFFTITRQQSGGGCSDC